MDAKSDDPVIARLPLHLDPAAASSLLSLVLVPRVNGASSKSPSSAPVQPNAALPSPGPVAGKAGDLEAPKLHPGAASPNPAANTSTGYSAYRALSEYFVATGARGNTGSQVPVAPSTSPSSRAAAPEDAELRMKPMQARNNDLLHAPFIEDDSSRAVQPKLERVDHAQKHPVSTPFGHFTADKDALASPATDNGGKQALGANDTSSSLHPTSSDSLEKVAMHERVVVGEEATGGAQEGTGAAEDAVDAADESGDTRTVVAKLAGNVSSGPSSQHGATMHPHNILGTGPERIPTGQMKTCSLCGSTKDMCEFGPKKGSRDGKDCYCRICSTLRRRYSIPVVRAAVESGTLHELLGPSKPRTTFSPSEMRQPARTSGQGLPPMMGAHERAAVIAPIASGNTLAVATGTSGTANGAGAKGLSSAPCVLCGVRKPQEEIALYVAGEAFCVPCDRLRRRANNLGMASKDVIDANRNGTLGDFLGMSAQQLAQEMGKAPAATTNDQGAAGAGNKAPIGRICRMCRQVRAPVFDGMRLSYCTDCEVVKERAQARKYTVAQLQDAFETNTYRTLFGDAYYYIVAGTRFDYGRPDGDDKPDAGEEIIPGMGALPIHSMDPAADEANEADDDTALKSRRRTKRKLADISEDLQDEGGPEDTDWGNAELPSVMGEARGGSAEGGTPAKNGVKKPLPMTGGPKQELLRRCALCRAIRPLSEFPLDGKRSHGRACYCHPCKRLRGRAQSVSKSYDTAWLRSALESNTLRERLGAAADSVLAILQPDKPVTNCLSQDAALEWAGDNPMVWRAAVVRAQSQNPAGAHSPGQPGRSSSHRGSPATGDETAGTLPGLGSKPPPGLPPMHTGPVNTCVALEANGQHMHDGVHGEPQGFGEQEGVSVAVGALTRTVLGEVREYAKMCLAVRERMLMPGLTEWQLEVERQTAAELEAHVIELRGLVSQAFLGTSQT